MRASSLLQPSGWRRLQALIDWCYSVLPQPRPVPQRLKHCKIVAHRGDHNSGAVMENTVAAFDRVLEAGVWGVELDVRWTRDLQPVVFHDETLLRLYGDPLRVGDLALRELQRNYPLIPPLEDLLSRYGKKMHLMVELKREHYPRPEHQRERLRQLFSDLVPVDHYHFLSLSPEMPAYVDFAPRRACVLVGERNLRQISEHAIKQNVGGVAGHYLLFSRSLLQKHRSAGQQVGTGYVGSRNCLYREINRGVDWIFSNDAVSLQSFCR